MVYIMLTSIIKQIKKLSVGAIIISLLAGVLFIAFPDKCITYISLAVGIGLIVIGVSGIINFLIDKSSAVSLVMGIIVALLGIFVCIKYQAIISFIIVIIGVFILIMGIFNFVTAIKVIASSVFFGWVTLAMSVLTAAFGVIAITKSGQLTIAVVQFIGVALIVYAVMDILSYIQVRRLAKNVQQAIASAGDIETDATIVEETDA